MSSARENAGSHFHVQCTSVFFKYVFINLQFNYALYLDRTIEMESETNLQQHMSVINYHKVRVVALLK